MRRNGPLILCGLLYIWHYRPRDYPDVLGSVGGRRYRHLWGRVYVRTSLPIR